MKVGDKVEVLDEAITGVIVSISGDKVEILSDLEFSMVFDKSELVVIGRELHKNQWVQPDLSDIISEKEKLPKKRKVSQKKPRRTPPMEVDLHIEKLTRDYKRMSNYEMLNLQMDTAKRQLQYAFQKKIQRVVFIHGVGQGVLRSELEFLLKRYENLKFEDADYQKYGNGALEVYIFQNKPPNY